MLGRGQGEAADKAEGGKAKVNAAVTYTPDAGEQNTESKRIKLVKRG